MADAGNKSSRNSLLKKTERHQLGVRKDLQSLCEKTTTLYNLVTYLQRQKFFWREPLFSWVEVINYFTESNQPEYRALPSQTAQQVIIQACRNWKAFFAAVKEYRRNPSSFCGRPKPPKYKRGKELTTAIFTNQQVRIKYGKIKFPRAAELELILATKVKERFCQVRFVPSAVGFVAEVIHDVEQKSPKVLKDNFIAIDLGVNNLAAIISNIADAIMINGKPLKSINQFFNKTKALAQSFVGARTKSRRLHRLNQKRDNKISDYMHKTSAFILQFCLANRIGTVIIGRNKNWKQSVNIGGVNNQNFVQIPHAKFIAQLSYKLREYGIDLVEVDESYTSKIDHFADEPMRHSESYIGKRVKRGLFQSSFGFLLNADVNGAVGIGRKAAGEAAGFAWRTIGRGRVARPIKLCFA